MFESKAHPCQDSLNPAILLQETKNVLPTFEFAKDEEELLSQNDKLMAYILALFRGQRALSPNDVASEEWRKILSALRNQWVLPLLYKLTYSLPIREKPPNHVISFFRKSFLHSHSKSLRYENQLQRILLSIRRYNIPAIILKGPSLSRTVYEHPGLRPYSDIDILVNPTDVKTVRNILVEQGYFCLEKNYEKAFEFFKDEEYIRKNGKKHIKSIEIHWDIHRFSQLRNKNTFELLFDKSIAVTTSEKVQFNSLNAIDTLIHRSITNSYIHFKDMRLLWIYDVKMLAEKLKIPEEWNDLMERCKTFNARIAVEKSLKIAEIWTDFKIPERFKYFETWPDASTIEKETFNLSIRRYKNPMALIQIILKNPTSIQKKIVYVYRLIFPSIRYVQHVYPSKCGRYSFIFSYMERLINWIKKYRRLLFI